MRNDGAEHLRNQTQKGEKKKEKEMPLHVNFHSNNDHSQKQINNK